MVWVNHFSAFTIYSWLTEKFLKVWKTANHYGIILKEVISCVDDCSSKWEKMPRNRGRQRKYPQEQGREILLINMELSPSLTMTWRGCPQSRQQFSTSSDCHFFSEQEFGKWYWCQSFLIFLGRYCLTSTGTRLTYISSDMQKVIRKT